MTNIYPYYINTGLFEGFSPPLRLIIPTLKLEDVTDRIHKAIMAEEKEVFIPGWFPWGKLLLISLPLGLQHYLDEMLVGCGMDYFQGRSQEIINAANKRKAN